jgi:hypothetical protein
MSALSANVDVKKSAGDVLSITGASGAHIYAGALVQVNSSGYAVAASGTSANRFMGVAWDELNNSSTNKKLSSVSDGGLAGRVFMRGVYTVTANGTPARTDIGKKAYVVDDQTVGLSAGAWCYAGRILDYTSSTYRLKIDDAIGVLGQDAGVSSAIAHDRLFA